MINENQLIEIGYISKLHGLKGEMNVVVHNDVFASVQSCPYFVCQIEGIFVPFFLTSLRLRNHTTILIQFEDITTQEAAEPFCGRTLYFDRRLFTEAEAADYDNQPDEDEDSLIGYTIIDSHIGVLGEIIDIDDQTENILFIVDYHGEQLLIPAADDLILDIDDEQGCVTMNLPDGLVDQSLAILDES